MRETEKILIWILLMFMGATMISAQTVNGNTDVASINEENERLEILLNTLTTRQKALSDTIKAQNSLLKNLDADIKKEEKALQKNQSKLDKSKIPALQKRQTELQASIDEMTPKIQELELQNHQLDKKLEEFNKRRMNLESVRNNVGKNLIDNYQGDLEKAFSKMDINNLYSIKSDCDRYKDDKNVKEFLKRVDKVISMKQAYDNAKNVVSQPFSKTNVNQALKSLPDNDMNSIQTEEMNAVRNELQGFEQGLNTFKELINALAKKRGTIFSKRDLDDELDIILNKDNLKGRINTQVMSVPYLKKKYNEYIKALQTAPTKQPTTEKEILAQ